MRLVITGGGTGGHLFPGIAVAGAMLERCQDAEILFITTARSMDQKVLRDSGVQTAVLHCSGLKGATKTETVKSLFRQPAAVLSAFRMMKRFKADLVFGVGGYVTGPVLVAAKMIGLPICIHEQNAIPGLTNRLAGKIADVICTSLPCGSYFPETKTVQTGNPVRREIRSAAASIKQKGDLPTLLVLGGSQGAHAVNVLVVEAAGHLCGKGIRFRIIHQTGSADYEWVESAYRKMKIDGTVEPFFSDMASIYSQADLAVSRAGATTLAELAVMGLPALLIPYPYAADLHQHANARFYTESGGCELYEERDLTGELLASYLANMLETESKRVDMGERMRQKGEPDAAGRIVDQCLALV